ncbi:MAG: ankyrin repeat domain-containing protein, partial [Lysobacteraceae bacterium]
MSERPARQPLRATVALLAGMALSLLPLVSQATAWMIGPLLAQSLFALAAAWWLGSRPAGEEFSRWLPDAVALLLLWSAAWLLAIAALAWPLPMLLRDGSLNAALCVSAAIGLVLVVLWRYWPVFTQAERTGGGLAALYEAANGEGEIATLRGLLVALAIASVLALLVVIGWAHLPGPVLRMLLVIAAALLAPLLHAAIHRLGRALSQPSLAEQSRLVMPAAEPVVFKFDTSGDPNLHAYAAARAGRADEALSALARGADPKRLPDPDERDQRSLPVLAAVISDLSLLRELIARGIDPNQMHAGLTPLLAATRDSWHGRIEAVTILLANGADPCAADADGNTPLHHAARSSDAGVA